MAMLWNIGLRKKEKLKDSLICNQNFCSYPDRVDILKTLASKDALHYSELKSLAGYKGREHHGLFVEIMLKVMRQSLVSLNKSDRTYSITKLGKSVLK